MANRPTTRPAPHIPATMDMRDEADRILAERQDGRSNTYLSAPHEAAANSVVETTDSFGAGMEAAAPRVIKHVSLPVVSMKQDGRRILCQIVSPITEGKQLTDSKRGPRMAPAHVCEVAALNGEHATLVCGTVLENELTSAYPDHTYVGKWFIIRRVETRDMGNGQSYGVYSIAEVAPPAGAVQEAQAAA